MGTPAQTAKKQEEKSSEKTDYLFVKILCPVTQLTRIQQKKVQIKGTTNGMHSSAGRMLHKCKGYIASNQCPYHSFFYLLETKNVTPQSVSNKITVLACTLNSGVHYMHTFFYGGWDREIVMQDLLSSRKDNTGHGLWYCCCSEKTFFKCKQLFKRIYQSNPFFIATFVSG